MLQKQNYEPRIYELQNVQKTSRNTYDPASIAAGLELKPLFSEMARRQDLGLLTLNS